MTKLYKNSKVAKKSITKIVTKISNNGYFYILAVRGHQAAKILEKRQLILQEKLQSQTMFMVKQILVQIPVQILIQ